MHMASDAQQIAKAYFPGEGGGTEGMSETSTASVPLDIPSMFLNHP